MKKFLVVGDSSFVDSEQDRIAQFRDFLADVVGTEAVVDAVFYDEIVFGLAKGVFTAVVPKNGNDLRDYSAVYVRGKRTQGYFLAKFCAVHGIPCINDYSQYYTPTKFAQTVVFREENVDFLQTYYSENSELLAQYAADQFGYPYILKANKGSHGDSNYLIRSAEDSQKALRDEPTVEFIAQQYCENDRDYRLLLVGEEMLLFERRAGAESHLNNTSKGGVATHVELANLPDRIIDEAKSLASKLGLKITGLDIIPRLGTDELYFLEINSQPQLRTGALLDEKRAMVHELFETF